MAENTAISWADDTFNPCIGCTKVSPACDGCYAEARMDTRLGRVTWGPHGERVRTSAANWAKPLKWDREARASGKPRFVFCASLADVFDNQVTAAWRRGLFDLIRKTPHLTWLLLTKRPGNIVKLYQDSEDLPPEYVMRRKWPSNAAIGCTVVTQAEADRDIPVLLAAKAALNPAFAFVSMEPLLGPVDLDTAWHGETALDAECWGQCAWCAKGYPALHNCQRGKGDWEAGRSGLDWVITGGETDQGQHKARPSHPDWFRALRDQCAAAGVAYHHKQNGEWAPDPELDRPFIAHHCHAELGTVEPLQSSSGHYAVAWTRRSEPKGSITEGIQLKRIGKKRAGRALDGEVHDARPEVNRL